MRRYTRRGDAAGLDMAGYRTTHGRAEQATIQLTMLDRASVLACRLDDLIAVGVDNGVQAELLASTVALLDAAVMFGWGGEVEASRPGTRVLVDKFGLFEDVEEG